MNHREAKRRRPQYPSSSSGLALQVRENHNGNDAYPATAIAPAAAPAEDESLLLLLSECCHRHQVSHHNKKGSNAAVWCQDDEEQVPDGCREAIDTLRKILPKVELKSMSIQREPGQKTRGPPARDVAHMCDFYTSALNGVFCPHAPHLFLLGKGATESKCSLRWRDPFPKGVKYVCVYFNYFTKTTRLSYTLDSPQRYSFTTGSLLVSKLGVPDRHREHCGDRCGDSRPCFYYYCERFY